MTYVNESLNANYKIADNINKKRVSSSDMDYVASIPFTTNKLPIKFASIIKERSIPIINIDIPINNIDV